MYQLRIVRRAASAVLLAATLLSLVACGNTQAEPTGEVASLPSSASTPTIGEPILSVPSPVGPGDKVGISVPVTGPAGAVIKYEWTAPAGTILEGQGTNGITYQAPSEPGTYRIGVNVTGAGLSFVRSIFVTVQERATSTATLTPIPPTSTTTMTPVPPTGTATLTPVPLTNTPSPVPSPSHTASPIATQGSATVECKCTNSGDCNTKAWQALDGKDFKTALACTGQTLRSAWIAAAGLQQKARQDSATCDVNPDPKTCLGTPQQPCTEYWGRNWAVNDVATAWFVRAQALCAQGQAADGKTAYQEVIDKYSCGWAWDPQGWWWRVADAARDGIGGCQ
jgi:hypothetical protein